MSVFMYLLNLLPLLCVLRYVCSSCVFQNGKYDLSMLDRPSGWPVSGTSINGAVFHFDISICRPLNYSSIVHQKGCPRSSVCLVSENSAVSFGKALENTSDYAIAENMDTGFSLHILTTNTFSKKVKYVVDINFSCGPHLGVPELMFQSECRSECHTYFFWRTSAACTVKPTNRQVPCYVLDERGDVRNLSPLIKDNDGYFVYTPNPSVNFIINVCSDLNLDASEINCPKNVSACKISGREYYSFGSVSEDLNYTPEGLLLTYKISDSSASPADCQLKPKTTVFFKCPARGNSQPPKLISDYNCQYEVEWETEYACPESMLKGDLWTCQFTEELHGVEIDLSPLRKKVYNVTSPTTATSFALSVCSGLGNVTCDGKSWNSTAICAFSSSGASEIAVSMVDSELLYVDGTVSLRYLRDGACNGSLYMSVINFICDRNASHDGDGEPRLAVSQNCINIFEWHTKHACLKHPLDTPCSVTYGKKTVNLQKLLLVEGEPWEAIDRTSQKTSQAEYFINVCGRISRLNYSMCGEYSSACAVNAKGEYLNLGNFTSAPEYDNVSDSVRLHSTGGSKCKENKTWHSTFNFICKPGQIKSKPVLTRIDETLCHYEFEWQTADACPTGFIEGSDCKVLDNNLGIKYDLTPLKSKVYKVDAPLYEFYLGVCEPVKDSPCTSSNVGVCQVDKSNQTAWNTGEPTSCVSYMDGVVNLTYLSGDPYYDQNRTARVTSIIFICDFNAGNGNPRFIEVEDFAFVFHWHTELVCPQDVLTECIVHDPFSHFIYNLSGLSMAKRNYMADVHENKKSRKIYFNVCRSLAMPTDCDPYAAACLVEQEENGEEKVIVSNLGRAVNPPVLKDLTRTSLTYTDGDVCQSLGENQTYSTRIQFLCSDVDSLQTDSGFFHKTGACEYSFVWHTKAACLVGNLPFKNGCQLTDPKSGFTFDLTSLHKIKEPYLTPSPSGGNFQFNICGKVVNGCFYLDGNKQSENISVCEVDNKGALKSNLATSDNYTLSYSASTGLTLTYKSTSKASNEVVIKFPCYNSKTTSKPKFMHYEDGQYIFEMKTPLTCIPEPVNCNLVDEYGHEYDLSHLAKYSGGNWEVSDIRPGYSHIKYHINFCRPLNKVASYRCPGGASSACQTNLNTPEVMGHDLGSTMNVKKIDSNGVVIQYYDGSPCFVNGWQRRAVIRLFCSSEESEMRFLTETSTCKFIFSLHTPAACRPETSQGKNCRVSDPLFSYTFNLNPLKSKHSNYNVSVGEYTYALNVCDKLNNFNNRCINSSVCQLNPSNPDFSKSLGLPSDVLVYRKGLITLEYKSGSGNCHGKYNRSTKITFICHHAHGDGPVFIAKAHDCTYLFEWTTRHACPPFDVTECSVVDDKGLHYDLNRLSLPNENYYVKHPMLNKTFIINVCRSVVHTPNSLCPYTSAACLVDSSPKMEPLNLGEPYLKPYFNNNGKIEIKYTAGARCNEEAAPAFRFIQTVIEFTCDPSLIDSEPEFIDRDACTYYFGWSTAYACPAKPVESQGDCTVKDPVTGHVFNFSSLKDHGFFNVKHGDHQYSLRICASKNSSACGDSAGMCQEELSGDKRHWKGGKVNNNLMYNNGMLLFNYSDGEQCYKEQFTRNTLIEFRCGHGINEPQFLYESPDCTYHFIFKTELACQTLIHCAVKNGSFFFDFAALAESHHHATTSILNDTADYYIKLCSSLDGDPSVKCPPGAAVCRRSLDSNGSYVTESLGKVEYQPFVDFLGHPTIIYTNGSTCKKNTDHQNHARIIFLCEADAGMGQPVLVNYDEECYFLFEWRTSIVCPEKPEVPSSFTSCNYTDSSRGIYFDLRPLQKTGTRPFYEASLGGKHMSFILNVCAPLIGSNVTKCSDAGVCGSDGHVVYNYGKAISQKITKDGYLKLMFFDGDDCPTGINGKRASSISFICDPTAGLGKPVKSNTMRVRYGHCVVYFWWKTALVCTNVQRQCSFDIDGHHYDFNLLSRLGHNWITSDTKNNTYWINICRGIETTVDSLGCLPTSAVCVQDKNGHHSSLGVVPTAMQIKSEKNSTDLILTFDNGDAAVCFSINSTTPLNATTRLFMRCGRSLGQPRITSGPDSQCYYDFVWESSLACANITKEMLKEKDGIIKNSSLGFSFDINDILNRTYIVPGNTTSNQYMYKINLSGGVAQNASDPRSTCAKAAICQTKSGGNFEIDIGSFQTRAFMVKGSELYLVLKSLTRQCDKNATKVITTLINMQCSSAAGLGSPKFDYESGNCDYKFDWPTAVVCPGYHRKNHNSSTDFVPNPFKDTSTSHHTAETVVGIIFAMIAVIIIAFIVVKSEKRAMISFRLRNSFGRVSLPHFRYRTDDLITEVQSEL